MSRLVCTTIDTDSFLQYQSEFYGNYANEEAHILPDRYDGFYQGLLVHISAAK
jgi:hypothetical protein